MSPQEIGNALNSLVEAEYLSFFNASTNTAKYNILYNIIDIKITNKIQNKLYLDIKNFIKYYVLATEEQDVGYDLISVDKVLVVLNGLALDQQHALLKVFARRLDALGFQDEKEVVDEHIHNVKLSIEESALSLKRGNGLLRYISLLSTKSLSNAIISLFIILLLEYLVLLPASNASVQTIEFQKVSFTHISLIDTFLSMLMMLVDADDRCKVTPLNWIGVIQLFIAKMAFVAIVGNFILKTIISKIKI